MPPRRSAGILLYRRAPEDVVQVLVGHMGGPFWAKKDERAWSIPKGEYEPDDDPLTAARREFEEELGSPPPAGEMALLGEVRVSSGKLLTVWALAGDLDTDTVQSNNFAVEWPPRSGRIQEFPEIDRAAWTSLDDARRLLVAGQVPFLDRLSTHLAGQGTPDPA